MTRAQKVTLEFREPYVLRLRQYSKARCEYLFGNPEGSYDIPSLFLLMLIAIHLVEFCNQLTVY